MLIFHRFYTIFTELNGFYEKDNFPLSRKHMQKPYGRICDEGPGKEGRT